MKKLLLVLATLMASSGAAQAYTVHSYDLWLEFTGEEDFGFLEYCDTRVEFGCSGTPQPGNTLRPVGPFSDLTTGDTIRFTATVESFGDFAEPITVRSRDCLVGRHACSGSSMYNGATIDLDSFSFWFESGSGYSFSGDTAVGSSVTVGLHDTFFSDTDAIYSVSWSWDYTARFTVTESIVFAHAPVPAPVLFVLSGLAALAFTRRMQRAPTPG